MKTNKKTQSVLVKSDSFNRGCNKKTVKSSKKFNYFLVSVDRFGEKRSRLFYSGTRSEFFHSLIGFFNHSFELNVPLKVSLSRSFFSCFNSDILYQRYRSDLSYFKDLYFLCDAIPVAFAMELDTYYLQKFYFVAKEVFNGSL